MINITENQIIDIGNVLSDQSRPLKERFRALFCLRNIGGHSAIKQIERSFEDPSALLKHELAYCLGQMQDEEAIPTLNKILEDVSQETIVRHEAAEALGAIGSLEIINILEKFKNDPAKEVAETCELALERIKWTQDPDNIQTVFKNSYNSVDPAPPLESSNEKELGAILLDDSADLFHRYRAMFSLRNLKTIEAIQCLGSALKYGGSLFRHEIAFVLGQLQHEGAIPFLIESLKDEEEHEMVRHESAEALGAIATKECIDILKRYLKDSKRVVRESCEIALDMCEYEQSPEFQYANTLLKV